MRTKWLSPVLAVLVAGMIAAPATAQTIAYTTFLKFDLQSYTSQATAGMFDDDIEMVSDAAKLMNVEGNRLFTSFSNLADPAGLGDNVLSYSVDHLGVPSSSDHFDTGSYLVGWIGKYDKDSEYNFSIFYQRNGAKAMFEDLEDGVIGGGVGGSFDAEYTGSTTSVTLIGDSTNTVTGDFTTNYNLMRYDERSATDFDFGAARDLSEDLSVGGRIFFEKDQVNSHAEGTRETVTRSDIDLVTAGTQLGVTSRTLTEYMGNGDEAFKYREMGVSLDGNYHAWEDQSVGLRVDIFGGNLTNPGGLSSALPSTFAGGPGQPTGPFYSGWARVNLRTDWTYTTSRSGTNDPGNVTLGGSTLSADRENRTWSTDSFSYPGYVSGRLGGLALQSVDDERTGIGFNAKGEYNRVWAGGDINSWVGFGRRSLDISSTTVMVDRSGSTFWWSDGTGDYEATTTTLDQSITSKRSGDMKMTTLEAGGRWNRDLNSNVSVGIGAVVTRETENEEYKQTDEDVRITDMFDDGNAGANALFAITSSGTHNERSTTRRITNEWDIQDETKTTYLRLPVGTQFHFKKRWTFNMGAMHTIMNTTRETQVDVPAGDGQVLTTSVSESAGTTTTTYGTSTAMRGTTATDKMRSNYTTYWYGLSVDVTDAVQVDINGFLDTNSTDNVLDRGLPAPNFSGSGSIADIDFWRNLAISMKYIFW